MLIYDHDFKSTISWQFSMESQSSNSQTFHREPTHKLFRDPTNANRKSLAKGGSTRMPSWKREGNLGCSQKEILLFASRSWNIFSYSAPQPPVGTYNKTQARKPFGISQKSRYKLLANGREELTLECKYETLSSRFSAFFSFLSIVLFVNNQVPISSTNKKILPLTKSWTKIKIFYKKRSKKS